MTPRGSLISPALPFPKVFPVSGNAVQKIAGADDNTLLNGGCCGDAFVMQLDLNRLQVGVAALALDGGDFQAGPAGSVLPNALDVHLADVNGNQLALSGYAVTFAATNGVTLVSPAEGVTDGTGVTGVRVKLGSANGTVTATLLGTTPSYTFHVIVGSGAGTPGCTYTLNPTSLQPTAAGGDSSINIQTGAGCAWSVTGSAELDHGLRRCCRQRSGDRDAGCRCRIPVRLAAGPSRFPAFRSPLRRQRRVAPIRSAPAARRSRLPAAMEPSPSPRKQDAHGRFPALPLGSP